jgi:hypothetical protein
MAARILETKMAGFYRRVSDTLYKNSHLTQIRGNLKNLKTRNSSSNHCPKITGAVQMEVNYLGYTDT